MSIATKLAKLKAIKQDIKSALEEKGQTPSNVFSTYANNIRAIETGGGGDTSQEDGLVTRTLTSYSNDRVNSVGEYVFYNIKTLTNVELPNVTSIGRYAFYNCTSLTNINLPKVTKLENDTKIMETRLRNLEDKEEPIITDINLSSMLASSRMLLNFLYKSFFFLLNALRCSYVSQFLYSFCNKSTSSKVWLNITIKSLNLVSTVTFCCLPSVAPIAIIANVTTNPIPPNISAISKNPG